MGQCERDYQRILEELEEIRVENGKTDKFLQVYQPITTLTEIDRMFRAVFPRRRHQTKMLNYTSCRQSELKNRIEERRFEKFEKTSYEIIEPYNFCMKESLDSCYIRESVALFRQQQRMKMGLKGSSGGSRQMSAMNLMKRKQTTQNLGGLAKRRSSNIGDEKDETPSSKSPSPARRGKRKLTRSTTSADIGLRKRASRKLSK